MPSRKDDVYANPLPVVDAFRFDARVADVFQDMIERSVPGYGLALQLIGVVTAHFAAAGTNCYDLGCSLGASTLQLRRHAPAGCRVIGIDNSKVMVERCVANMQRIRTGADFEIRHEDIRDTIIENASMAILNFTLQFVPDDGRLDVLQKIAKGLNPGGILLLAEKIIYKDGERQTFMTELHHDFKKMQGYSDMEIAQKRTALENVLTPNTHEIHVARLKAAGFSKVELCLRCLNFEAILAIR